MRNVIFLLLIIINLSLGCNKKENSPQIQVSTTDSTLTSQTTDNQGAVRENVVASDEVLPQVVTTNDGALPSPQIPTALKGKTDSIVASLSENRDLSLPDLSANKVSEKASEVSPQPLATAVPAPIAAPIKLPKVEISNPPAGGNEADEANPVLSHAAFDQLLKRHVTEDGRVNYMGFIKDKIQFDAYLNILTRNPVQATWERNKKLAYWINVYNAFTIKRVMEKYPIHNMKDDINPWKEKNIRLGTETYSLDQIENEIVRVQFKDARIHFALNCGAKSCPKLLNEAYMPDKLDAQLNKQTEAFINNTLQNTISDKKAELSKIFEWYAADFGNIVAFFNSYLQTPLKENVKITYKEYNWSLNE
ncbi:MAG: DUF547 domain-containing protein [Ferruginibacter sp.]